MLIGKSKLTFRSIQGMFYDRLQASPAPYVSALALAVDSDQSKEDYAWLGKSPSMREWVGGRNIKRLREFAYTIENKPYEVTLGIKRFDVDHGKTEQVAVRINELADGANGHAAKLLSSLINSGAAKVCYDGKYFFDTTHAEGDSGTQSNIITVARAGSAPTAGEMETAILKAVEGLLTIKDDTGEPMNEGAQSFRVMVPVSLMSVAAAALKNPIIVDGGTSRTNTIATNVGGFEFALDVNSRLTSFTNKIAVFRADGNVKPFIFQEVDKPELSELAEGSEHAFKNDEYLYGVRAVRGMGYGLWQHAALVNIGS